MKKYNQVFFILMLLGAATQAMAYSRPHNDVTLESGQDIVKTQNAIKSASLRISLDDTLHGIIVSKNCSFCKTIRIAITPKTKAYNNNINVPLMQAKNRIGQYATIIYDTTTNKVSSIRW